ncbi:hypothetical protein DY000_02015086 [Brassica cretica]|uniref:Uncharacterized protein n=1 Tax=Brassica cretica TaxID=69181 RepID=A0ABQ7CYY3_BRACR|nr:hypothetical protein DY000_02015086 [Brassica cretica]
MKASCLVQLAHLASWTSPTQQMGELDGLFGPARQMGELDGFGRSNSPIWRVGRHARSNSPNGGVGRLAQFNSPVWWVGRERLPPSLVAIALSLVDPVRDMETLRQRWSFRFTRLIPRSATLIGRPGANQSIVHRRGRREMVEIMKTHCDQFYYEFGELKEGYKAYGNYRECRGTVGGLFLTQAADYSYDVENARQTRRMNERNGDFAIPRIEKNIWKQWEPILVSPDTVEAETGVPDKTGEVNQPVVPLTFDDYLVGESMTRYSILMVDWRGLLWLIGKVFPCLITALGGAMTTSTYVSRIVLDLIPSRFKVRDIFSAYMTCMVGVEHLFEDNF